MVRLGALACVALIFAGGCGAPPQQSTRSPSPERASLTVVYGTNLLDRGGSPHCPNWPDHADNVVLAQAALTYSPEQIGRMAAVAGDNGFVDHSRLDPSLLAVQPGVAIGSPSLPPADVLGWIAATNCAFELDVTNTGTVAVQIPRVGVRLTSAAMPNSAAYRLVEVCSIMQVSHYCGPELGHGPPPCSFYGIEVSLSNQPAGSDFVQAPSAIDYRTNQPCPPVTLQPQQATTLIVGVYSRYPLIYHAVPILEVITPTGTRTEPFTALAAAFVFADPSQFTCYKLSGTTFTPWRQGAGAYDFEGNAHQGGWCV